MRDQSIKLNTYITYTRRICELKTKSKYILSASPNFLRRTIAPPRSVANGEEEKKGNKEKERERKTERERKIKNERKRNETKNGRTYVISLKIA